MKKNYVYIEILEIILKQCEIEKELYGKEYAYEKLKSQIEEIMK